MALHLNNLEFPFTKDDLCLVWLNFVNGFSLLHYYLPLEKEEAFICPYSKDALCQVWLKLAQWFLRRFLNFVIVFSLCRNYLHLENGVALHLNTLESLFNQGCSLPSLVEIVTVVLENKSKM